MLRPFEREIVRGIRASPRRSGRGGRSVPRKGAWIKGHLQEVGKDYPYRMHKLWSKFLEDAGLKIEAGSYQQFRTYIYVLKRLGLIRRVGAETSKSGGFSKNYYALNPDKADSPLWDSPYKQYHLLNLNRLTTLYV